MDTFIQIVENIVLLSLMSIAYFLVVSNRRSLGALRTNILIGLCLGLTAALVTMVPVVLPDGATVDARAGPIVLSGIVAGPVGAVIAACIGAVARGLVGGSFALSGMIVFFVYAIAGLALQRSGLIAEQTLASIRSIVIASIASMLGASLMFFLIQPEAVALRWLQFDLPYILVANVLSVTVSIVCIGLVVAYIHKSEQLVELNDTLRLAKRAGGFGVWDFDIATGTLKWDKRSRELHGVDGDSFEGTFDDWAANVHPDDLERATTDFKNAIDRRSTFVCEYRVLLPNGTENRIKGNAFVICDDDGNPSRVVGSNMDLTDIRRTEANLASAQSLAVQALKVESVGQLTGGIAHDFNNMLAVVLGNLELLMLKQNSGSLASEDARKLIDSSIQAARRGSDLTKNMLAYARKARLQPTTVNLNDVVMQTQGWISRTIESSVDFQSDLEPEIWSTLVDESSLQSALVNLIVNARDAVAGAGRVTIRTENTVFDQGFVDDASERLEAGRYVMLSVSDDGVGMDRATQLRIFDPFYTTKAIGQGTGLGLSTVQGFVKQSRGAIRVQSTPGVGTTFRLYFPVSGNAGIEGQESAAEEQMATQFADGGGGRILLVEDQADVRDTIGHMLENGGYQVSIATSGDQAFDMCSSSASFDLVLSDVVMPGKLQGQGLADALHAKFPELPILLITGYDKLERAINKAQADRYPRLEKPIAKGDLLRAVHKTIKNRYTDARLAD